MAQPDISQILAALSKSTHSYKAETYHKSSGPGGTPIQPPGSAPPANPAYPPYGAPPAAAYGLPQPVGSGNVDLSNIRPTNSGSVSFNDDKRGGRNSYDDGRNCELHQSKSSDTIVTKSIRS